MLAPLKIKLKYLALGNTHKIIAEKRIFIHVFQFFLKKANFHVIEVETATLLILMFISAKFY